MTALNMFVITFFSANYITNITPRPQMAQPMQKQWYTQNVKSIASVIQFSIAAQTSKESYTPTGVVWGYLPTTRITLRLMYTRILSYNARPTERLFPGVNWGSFCFEKSRCLFWELNPDLIKFSSFLGFCSLNIRFPVWAYPYWFPC